MTVTDAAGWGDLLDQAELRLRRIDQVPDPTGLIEELQRLGRTVSAEPTDRAAAAYVSQHTSRAVRLGVPVVDRVVIDTTFATRDLVLTLQRTPRHVVLVLSSRQARLFESVNGVLQPARTPTFPLQSHPARRSDPNRPGLAHADTAMFLRSVAAALRTYRALHPSPLVLVGRAPILTAFLDAAGRPDRLAGTMTGNHLDASLTELAELTRPVIQRYLASREQEALELVSLRTRQGRSPPVWKPPGSPRTEQPEMLAVEQGLFYPARLSPEGHSIHLSLDIDEPDFLDDAVDELIEHVLIRGGWVAFVSDGALTRHHGVALTRR
jgi:hypothetical protein